MNEDSGTWNPPGAALFDAVERNDLTAVEALLSRGADVDAPDPRHPPWYAAPALVTAAGRGYTEMVRLLLANGADVNARDAAGGTALIWACNGERADCARLLLAAGADPRARNDLGYTAYGRIPERNEELLRLLEERDGPH
ncbi:ankyrin repeat domain-containing protein [Actinomadura sp. DC4]|uniref:ankyrin repeat domain-containing protein n=1 Tax=Actinomadura sp. DC4 TaxID=3055069 RepID=UPI0025B0C4DC|nr:ankyrin repeat domain-containing protein [Actinomadura sp. DC4]MDN3354250.1 ankyrin repeat domain-containing protein [Actinomadura sp. DC4]